MPTEVQKESIRKEARAILDSFAKKLASIKTAETKKQRVNEGMRKEVSGQKGDADFIERMFTNAPKKTKDCIVAEKATW